MSLGSRTVKDYSGRINGEYISNQVLSMRASERHNDHKKRINDGDSLYAGDLRALFPEQDLPSVPYVENKYKNALHDLARLSAEAKPMPVWMVKGSQVKETVKARIREQIALTIWEMGGQSVNLERRIYMDMAGAGYAALAVFYNDECDYAQFMRLDPRMCYPDVRNGKLVSMLYVETIPLRQMALEYPDVVIPAKDADKDCLIVTYYDKDEVVQSVCQTQGPKVLTTDILPGRWIHNLGVVPVAFRALDTYDGTYRGMLDQLGGPLMIRNKVVAYLDDYLEDMVHAPYESKNVLNSEELPGPGRVYQHDPNADESFIRRVAPASPAGAVFGLLNYMDDQESREAIQPPSRVGSVSQSIASGSFVASTQGSLSSAVKELQDMMADLRKQFHTIAFKIEEKYLDFEKPLIRAVGKKMTYTPSRDIGGNYTHRILFGAAAGVDVQYADVRVLQHQGAGFISKETARQQINYLDDASAEQDRIDREQAANILFQRFASDPNTSQAQLAKIVVELGKGNSLIDVMEQLAEEMAAAEEAAKQAAEAQAQEMAGAGGPEMPDGQALEKGAVPEGEAPAFAPLQFAPPPLQQQIVSSR